MGPTYNTYVAAAFKYINANKNFITKAAGNIGVSKTAVAAFIAKENNSYETIPIYEKIADRQLDDFVKDRATLPNSNVEFRNQYNRVVADHLADGVANMSTIEKISAKYNFQVLADVGVSNIKLSTAIGALDKYIATHPNDDPLALKQYQNDLGKFATDLINPDKETTGLVATLIAKDAQDYFIQPQAGTGAPRVSPANWAALTQESKDALIVTYMTVGEATMNKLYADNIARNDGVYKPQPGVKDAGGEWSLQNAPAIGNAIGATGYGQNTTAPSFGYAPLIQYAPDGSVLQAASSRIEGNSKIDVIWTQDGSNNYIKTETITTLKSDGKALSAVVTQYTYNSDGSPVSALATRKDAKGQDIDSVNLVIASDGKTWIKAGAGAVTGTGATTPITPPAHIDTLEIQTDTIPNTNGYQLTSTINNQTGVATAVLRDGSGNAVLSAAPGQTMTRDPQTGVFTVTTTATKAAEIYDPTTGNRILVDASGGGMVLGRGFDAAGYPNPDVYFAPGGLTQNANGSYTITPMPSSTGVAAALTLFNADDSFGNFTSTATGFKYDLVSRGGTLQSTTTSQTSDDGTSLATITYANGRQTVISTATDGSSKQVDYPVPGDLQAQAITLRDPAGNVTGTSVFTPSPDENNNPIPGVYDIVNKDGAGTVTATGVRTVNPITGAHEDQMLSAATPAAPNGSIWTTKTDANGKTVDVLTGAAQQTLANNTQGFLDAVNLAKAIESGKPLPITTSGITVYNDLTGGVPPSLLSAVGVVGGLSSLNNTYQALEKGHEGTAIVSGANTVNQFASMYASSVGYTAQIAADGTVTSALNMALTDNLELGGTIFGDSAGLIGAASEAIPYLNIANDLIHGNVTGAVADGVGFAVSQIYAVQLGVAAGPVGVVVGLVLGEILGDIFGDDPPQPWGSASAAWDASTGYTTIAVSAVGDAGGDKTASGTLTWLEGNLVNITTQYNTATATQPDLHIGIIPQRLGGLGYSSQSFHVSTNDPATGAALNPDLRFDATTGQTTNAQPGDPAYFQTLGQYYINNALARQAIAPEWEVKTAQAQAANHQSNAGLSEVERAAALGHLAAAVSSTTTETWNPIALDLGGGLSTTALSSSTVSFNVDGTADLAGHLNRTATPQFQKQTQWLNRTDAFLVLDKNANGAIDDAEELFSNSAVNAQSRGVASLATWDADGNGVINSADPMFNQLDLWIDKNGNGRMEEGEAKTLGNMGITSLNYNANTYTTSDGNTSHQMSTLTLQANTSGTAYAKDENGIVMTTTEGKVSLLVTQLKTLGNAHVVVAPPAPTPAPAPGTGGGSPVPAPSPTPTPAQPKMSVYDESFTSTQNVTATILVHGNAQMPGLLDADSVSDGSALTLVGVNNAAHGTVSYDAATGVVNFVPDNNYWGNEAGFDYTVSSSAGTATAHVSMSVAHVNQAPHITGELNTQIPVYGYIPNLAIGRDDHPVVTLYQPGWGYIDPLGRFGGNAYRDVPITYETDPFSGNFSVTDPDTPASGLTWSVVGQGHHGTASVDNNGHWTFTGAAAIGGTDAFMVKVSDGEKSDTYTVTVALPPEPPYSQPDGGEGVGPIILDLGNSGFHFTSVKDSTAFVEQASDGLRHRTAWVTGGNGVLAFDKYGDGVVHDSSQIAFKDYLPSAQTDLQGLAAFDSNHDGVIDKNDALWGRLGAWVDANQDGLSQPGEYKTLDALGVTSINLSSNKQFSVSNGTTVFGTTTFTRTDGSTGQAADVSLPMSNDVLVANADGSTRVTQVAIADPSQPKIVGDGNNLVFGDKGDNVISAGKGNNVITTGAGNDLIHAGNGNNTILSGDGKDLVVLGNGNNTLMLGAGPKTVVLGGGNNFVAGGAGNNLIMAGSGNNTLYAGNGNSVVYAQNGQNTLAGGLGRNELIAGNGDNHFTDGGGRADMYAGTGSNTFVVTNVLDTITVKDAVAGTTAGTNTVKASVNWTLGANQQILWGTGSTALTLRGNDAGNQIIGNGAADTLIGGAGKDALADSGGAATMAGGAGDDTYIITNSATVVTESINNGFDTVKTSVSYTLPQNVEKLIATGNGNISLTGNAGNNVLQGNAGNNTLTGGAADDVLDGGTGADSYVFAAGDGHDTVKDLGAPGEVTRLVLGAGVVATAIKAEFVASGYQLYLQGAATGDSVLLSGLSPATAGSANLQMVFADGTVWDTQRIVDISNHAPVVAKPIEAQTAYSSKPFSLSIPMAGASASFTDVDAGDKLTLSAGLTSGAALPAWLKFDAATNTFSGTPDVNRPLTATTAPDDDITVQLTATDKAGAKASSSFALHLVDVGEGAATAGNDFLVANPNSGAGGAGVGNLPRLNGGDGDDTLYGSWNGSTLIGGRGNDTLIAPGGPKNWLDGGAGDDKLYGGWGEDTLIGGEGNNTITANGSISHISAGSGNDTIYGGWGTNDIDAGDGDNQITATGGSSTIKTGRGNDRIITGWTDDFVVAGDGRNTVDAGAGNNIVATGNGADRINTSWGNDQISSGAGDDVIDAGAGNNIVSAGDGNDSVTGSWGADWVAGGRGNDTITDGGGSDILAFNRGDGQDTLIHNAWGQGAISLGGGIKYADLKLVKHNSDLVLEVGGSTGSGDSITLKNWYGGQQGITKLQVVTVGGDYNAASADPLRNKQVEVFDFAALVRNFDAATASSNPNATANANGWAVMNSLLSAHLQDANNAALGGDLSFEYATHGNLATVGLGAAKTNITAGNDWRTLSSPTQLAQGSALQTGVFTTAFAGVGLA